jgi:NitT/TauT family transport system permease protein
MVLCGLIATWQVCISALHISATILPSPVRVVQTAYALGPLLLRDIYVTLYEVLAGFFLGNVLAVCLAYVISRWVLAERAIYPFLLLSQTVPVLAIAPLLVIWFGTGIATKVIVVAVVCFFPTAVNLVEGLKSTDPDLLALLRLATSSRWVAFIKIEFPNSLPYLFAGLEISVATAVVGAIVGEWVGATEGLGYLILYGGATLRTDMMFVGVVATVLLGIALYSAVAYVKRSFSWKLGGA